MNWKKVLLEKNIPLVVPTTTQTRPTQIIEKKENVSFDDEFDLKYQSQMIDIKMDFEHFCHHMGIPFRLHSSFWDFIKTNTEEGIQLKHHIDKINYNYHKNMNDENHMIEEEENILPTKDKSFTPP